MAQEREIDKLKTKLSKLSPKEVLEYFDKMSPTERNKIYFGVRGKDKEMLDNEFRTLYNNAQKGLGIDQKAVNKQQAQKTVSDIKALAPSDVVKHIDNMSEQEWYKLLHSVPVEQREALSKDIANIRQTALTTQSNEKENKLKPGKEAYAKEYPLRSSINSFVKKYGPTIGAASAYLPFLAVAGSAVLPGASTAAANPAASAAPAATGANPATIVSPSILAGLGKVAAAPATTGLAAQGALEANNLPPAPPSIIGNTVNSAINQGIPNIDGLAANAGTNLGSDLLSNVAATGLESAISGLGSQNPAEAGTSLPWSVVTTAAKILGVPATLLFANKLNEYFQNKNQTSGKPQGELSKFLFGDYNGGNGAGSQFSNRTPEQQAIISKLGQLGLSGLENNKFDFAPIEAQARSDFKTKTVPSIAERFSNSGGSSAFGKQLGEAGSDLETRLAALRSQTGLQQQNFSRSLAELGITPQFNNAIVNPKNEGLIASSGIAQHFGQQGITELQKYLDSYLNGNGKNPTTATNPNIAL